MDYKLTLSQLDNGIFEVLRKEFVRLGVLPDITAYVGTAAQINTQYNAAKAVLRTAGVTIMEVFSVGGYQSRGELNQCNIIVDRKTSKPAATGTGRVFEYTLVDRAQPKFDKAISTDSKFDIPYSISYVCKLTAHSEIIEAAIMRVIGARKYITALKDDATAAGNFWLIQKNQFDTSDGEKFIERGWMFIADNIDLTGATALDPVGQFTEFTLSVEPYTSEDILTKISITVPGGGADFILVDRFNLGYSMVKNLDGTYTISGPDAEHYSVDANGVLTYQPNDL